MREYEPSTNQAFPKLKSIADQPSRNGSCMAQEKIEKLGKRKLPFFYRLLPRIPSVKSESLPSAFQGFFWVIALPLLIAVEVMVTSYLVVLIPSPANYISLCVIPVVVLILFAKRTLLIDWWNGFVSDQNQQWDVKKTILEYKKLLENRPTETECKELDTT